MALKEISALRGIPAGAKLKAAKRLRLWLLNREVGRSRVPGVTSPRDIWANGTAKRMCLTSSSSSGILGNPRESSGLVLCSSPEAASKLPASAMTIKADPHGPYMAACPSDYMLPSAAPLHPTRQPSITPITYSLESTCCFNPSLGLGMIASGIW